MPLYLTDEERQRVQQTAAERDFNVNVREPLIESLFDTARRISSTQFAGAPRDFELFGGFEASRQRSQQQLAGAPRDFDLFGGLDEQIRQREQLSNLRRGLDFQQQFQIAPELGGAPIPTETGPSPAFAPRRGFVQTAFPAEGPPAAPEGFTDIRPEPQAGFLEGALLPAVSGSEFLNQIRPGLGSSLRERLLGIDIPGVPDPFGEIAAAGLEAAAPISFVPGVGAATRAGVAGAGVRGALGTGARTAAAEVIAETGGETAAGVAEDFGAPLPVQIAAGVLGGAGAIGAASVVRRAPQNINAIRASRKPISQARRDVIRTPRPPRSAAGELLVPGETRAVFAGAGPEELDDALRQIIDAAEQVDIETTSGLRDIRRRIGRGEQLSRADEAVRRAVEAGATDEQIMDAISQGLRGEFMVRDPLQVPEQRFRELRAQVGGYVREGRITPHRAKQIEAGLNDLMRRGDTQPSRARAILEEFAPEHIHDIEEYLFPIAGGAGGAPPPRPRRTPRGGDEGPSTAEIRRRNQRAERLRGGEPSPLENPEIRATREIQAERAADEARIAAGQETSPARSVPQRAERAPTPPREPPGGRPEALRSPEIRETERVQRALGQAPPDRPGQRSIEEIKASRRGVPKEDREATVAATRAVNRLKARLNDVRNASPDAQPIITRDLLVDVLNAPRSLLSTIDVSGTFRQGGPLSARHPDIAFNTQKAALRAMFSEDAFQRLDAEHWSVGQTARRTDIPNPRNPAERVSVHRSEIGGKLEAREEEFMSRVVSKIPGVRASERHFVGYLNTLRAEVFDHWDDFHASRLRNGEISRAEYDQIRYDLARFVNYATGRGSMPNVKIKGHEFIDLNDPGLLAILNGLFFSPRLLASRFQVARMALPTTTLSGTASPEVRQLARETLAVGLGGPASIITLGAMSGLWETEFDPTSSDFMQLRVGPSRLDPYAGFRPIVNLFARSAPALNPDRLGQGVIKTSSGDYRDVGLLELLARFGRTKLSPTAGTAINLITGENIIGEPVTLDSFVRDLTVPLSLRDIWEGYKEQGILGAGLGLGGMIGFGFTSYRTTRDVENEVSMEIHGVPFDEINPNEPGYAEKVNAVRRNEDVLEKRLDRGGEAAEQAESRYQDQLSDDARVMDVDGGMTWDQWEARRRTRGELGRAINEMIFGRDSDEPPFPNVSDDDDDKPYKVWLNTVWENTDQATGEVDWDRVSAFEAMLSDAELENINNILGRGDTPLELQRRNIAFEVAREGGFDISDDTFREVALANGLPAEVADGGITNYRNRLFREFRREGQSIGEASANVSRDPVVREYNGLVSEDRYNWVVKHPLLTLQAEALGIWTTNTTQREFLEPYFEDRPDIAFDERSFLEESERATQAEMAVR